MHAQHFDVALIPFKINPLTIRSPHHTEEIATVWNYLLPTGANARLIAAAPALLEAAERAEASISAWTDDATDANSAAAINAFLNVNLDV